MLLDCPLKTSFLEFSPVLLSTLNDICFKIRDIGRRYALLSYDYSLRMSVSILFV